MKADRYTTRSKVIPETDFVVTNPETVVRRLCELQSVAWDAVIVDEAHMYKNHRGVKRTKALHKIVKPVRYLWLLSASPATKNPAELWSLLHAIDPIRYSSYWRFVEQYCYTKQNYFGGIDIGGVKDEVALATELAPRMLRRDKSILGLPPVSYETRHVELVGEQARMYRDMRRTMIAAVDEAGEQYVSAPSILAQLTRLRQITCTPALLGGSMVSVKADALMDILDTYGQYHKVLVFSMFRTFIDILTLRTEKYGSAKVTGAMSEDARWKSVQAFQNDDSCRVLLGTIGAMSEGLNLHAAEIVVFTDIDWTPESTRQAVGRAHRRGQTKPVHVIFLMAKGTVDHHVLRVARSSAEKITPIMALRQIIRGVLEDG